MFASNDDKSKLLQSRTIPSKSDFGMNTFKVIKSLIDQEAVTVTNLFYHEFYAGGYCRFMIAKERVQVPPCRYHVSKETFLPTVTSYVYGHAIGAELKSRLDRVLKIYFEYGIEDFESQNKPRIVFRTISGSEDAYFCTRRKNSEQEQSFPTNVSLKALKKTIFCACFLTFAATFVLFLEMVAKVVSVAKEKRCARAAEPKYQEWVVVSTYSYKV